MEEKASAFSPTDLVATALGTCAMTVMGLVAQRHSIDLTGTTVKVVKEMVSEPARRIGLLTVVFHFPKHLELSDADKTRFERAVQLCPVKQSLHPDVNIDVKFVYPR